jgi:hypothetical protein
MAGQNTVETPGGFVVNCPWKTLDKAVYVDLKATLASERVARNVLSVRNAAKSRNNLLLEQTVKLGVPINGIPQSYELKGVAGNVMTIFASNYPVSLELTTETGTLLLGQNTLFVITASIVGLKITNDQGLGDAECNIIHV